MGSNLRPVIGYEGLYLVNDEGRVFSVPHRISCGLGRFRQSKAVEKQPVADRKGYLQVSLSRPGERGHSAKVHRLVAEAFIGPRPEGQETAHLNGDKRDNRAANLAYVTSLENAAHTLAHGTRQIGEQNHRAKLTNAQAVEIARRHALGETASTLAVAYGVSLGAIVDLLSGRNWSRVTGLAA